MFALKNIIVLSGAVAKKNRTLALTKKVFFRVGTRDFIQGDFIVSFLWVP